MSQILRRSLPLLLGGLLLQGAPPGFGRAPEGRGAESLAPFLEHQAEARYHKCSEGLYAAIKKGLPAETSALARVHLAQCLSEIRLPTSSAVIFYQSVRLQRERQSAEVLLGEWATEVFKIGGGALYGLGALKDLSSSGAGLAPGEDVAFLVGLRALSDGDDVAAILRFQDIPADHALAPQSRYFEGVAYARQGDAGLAKAAFEQALSLGREGSDGLPMGDLIPLCWLALGRIAYGQQDFREALGHYGRAALSPRIAPEIQREEAWTLLRMERLTQAFPGIKKMVEGDDWQPDALFLLASAYMAAGRIDTAEAVLDAFQVKLKADLATLRDVQRRFTRRNPETLVPHLLQAMGETLEAEPEIPLALPKGFREHLIQDWRLEAARAHLGELRREARWISAQMDWWKASELGKDLPGFLAEAERQVLRETGLVGIDRLEASIRQLDKLTNDGILLRRELGRLRTQGRGDDYMLGTLPPWPFVAAPAAPAKP